MGGRGADGSPKRCGMTRGGDAGRAKAPTGQGGAGRPAAARAAPAGRGGPARTPPSLSPRRRAVRAASETKRSRCAAKQASRPWPVVANAGDQRAGDALADGIASGRRRRRPARRRASERRETAARAPRRAARHSRSPTPWPEQGGERAEHEPLRSPRDRTPQKWGMSSKKFGACARVRRRVEFCASRQWAKPSSNDRPVRLAPRIR